MKLIKKMIVMMMVLAVMFSVVACGGSNNSKNPENPPQVLILDKESVSLQVGETVSVTANIKDVFWESESDQTAVVINGVITGVSIGDTRVKATYGNQVKFVTVAVTDSGSYSAYPVLAFESKASTVVKDYTFDLDACVLYSGEVIDDCQIAFESSNNEILTVNSNGVVTAIAAGTATIIASATYQGELLSEEIEITVVDSVLFITFNNVRGEYDLALGETFTIDASLKSLNETLDPSDIQWESGNPAIVSIENGTMMGVGAGRTTVYAKYDGVVLNSCDVETFRNAFTFEYATINDLDYITVGSGNLSIVDYATENSSGAIDDKTKENPTDLGKILKWTNTGSQDSRFIWFDFGRTLPAGTKITFDFFTYNPNTTDQAWFNVGTITGRFSDSYFNNGMATYWSNNEVSVWRQYWVHWELVISDATSRVHVYIEYGAGCMDGLITDKNALVYYFDNFSIVE